MKVVLPEHIGDIKLYQFQDYDKLLKRELDDFEFNKRKVSCFTNLKYHDLNNVSNKDFENILNQIDVALNTEHPFVNRFELNGIEYGFIPNFDKITQGEYIDLVSYPSDDIENYNKVMAILFRPIIDKDRFGNYQIESYKGDGAYDSIMKQMPLSVVNGAMVFFCNLGKDLLNSTPKSTSKKEIQKDKQQVTTLKNGDGIQR